MIQTGWLVSDFQLILYVKTKFAIKWWLSNTSSNVAIWQYIAIGYKAIRNMVLIRIVASYVSLNVNIIIIKYGHGFNLWCKSATH